MSQIAVSIVTARVMAQSAGAAKGDLESALPGEWTMLMVLVAMTAVLGAAVLAGGVFGHQRLVAQRAERRQALLASQTVQAGQNQTVQNTQAAQSPQPLQIPQTVQSAQNLQPLQPLQPFRATVPDRTIGRGVADADDQP
jgi:hypothetical protein